MSLITDEKNWEEMIDKKNYVCKKCGANLHGLMALREHRKEHPTHYVYKLRGTMIEVSIG